MRYSKLYPLFLAALALMVLVSPAAASPTLNWIDVGPKCIGAGDSLVVLANVTLPHPCYGADFQVLPEAPGGCQIGIRLLTLDTLCAQVLKDTTYTIIVRPPIRPPTVFVSIIGQSDILQAPLAYVFRGDINLNGIAYEIADLALMVDAMLRSRQIDGYLADCWQKRADIDHSGRLNLIDIVWMWQIIIGERQPMP